MRLKWAVRVLYNRSKKEKSHQAYVFDIKPYPTSEYHSINGYSLGRMLLGQVMSYYLFVLASSYQRA